MIKRFLLALCRLADALEKIATALEHFDMDAPKVHAILAEANIPVYLDGKEMPLPERVKLLADRTTAIKNAKDYKGEKDAK